MISFDPVNVGAVHDSFTCPFAAVAVRPVGAPGEVAGMTAFEVTDATLCNCEFVAVTSKVYTCPLVSPVTVQPNGPEVAETLHVFVESLTAVTVYDVIALEPGVTDAPHVTVAWPLALVARGD
jgi:hypothetical protein